MLAYIHTYICLWEFMYCIYTYTFNGSILACVRVCACACAFNGSILRT